MRDDMTCVNMAVPVTIHHDFEMDLSLWRAEVWEDTVVSSPRQNHKASSG